MHEISVRFYLHNSSFCVPSHSRDVAEADLQRKSQSERFTLQQRNSECNLTRLAL